MRSGLYVSVVLLCSVAQCLGSCSRQGYQCEGTQSLNCRCWNERVCHRRSGQEELSAAGEGGVGNDATFGGDEADLRAWKTSTSNWGSSNSQNCRNRQRCAENFRENCENGCNDANGICKDDTEVCGTTWAPNFDSGFCGGDMLPSNYLSWKNHMDNNDQVCAGKAGENCANLGARNDADWFVANARAFPIKRTLCQPDADDNTTLWCMNGTIPDSLKNAASFFSASNTQTLYEVTDSSLLETGTVASVTVTPSECVDAWSTFSCQRNIPECQNDLPASAQCYDVCEKVSMCLDAFLLHCLNLSATPAGRGDCDNFNWSTAPGGGECNPGFDCQGLQADSTLTAAEVRNCRQGAEKCQDRPYMLSGGYCQADEDLPNLCEQFQQDPAPKGGGAPRRTSPLLAVLAALVSAAVGVRFSFEIEASA